MEYKELKLWITLQAPAEVFFDDDETSFPPQTPPNQIPTNRPSLYQRLLCSLPREELNLQ